MPCGDEEESIIYFAAVSNLLVRGETCINVMRLATHVCVGNQPLQKRLRLEHALVVEHLQICVFEDTRIVLAIHLFLTMQNQTELDGVAGPS